MFYAENVFTWHFILYSPLLSLSSAYLSSSLSNKFHSEDGFAVVTFFYSLKILLPRQNFCFQQFSSHHNWPQTAITNLVNYQFNLMIISICCECGWKVFHLIEAFKIRLSYERFFWVRRGKKPEVEAPIIQKKRRSLIMYWCVFHQNLFHQQRHCNKGIFAFVVSFKGF